MAQNEPGAHTPSLFEAVARSDLPELQKILSTPGLDIGARDPAGRTALHAIIAASTDVIECLVEHGAQVDLWTGQGEPAVHLAPTRGDVDIMNMIMNALSTKRGTAQAKDTATYTSDSGKPLKLWISTVGHGRPRSLLCILPLFLVSSRARFWPEQLIPSPLLPT
jgi:ankyrin repeat protein